MDRLTNSLKFPLDTFKRCQLCGHTSRDICEFRMWMECDDTDQPDLENIFILCTRKECTKIVDDHPRLYIQVPWSRGGPGKFMLLCGDCKFRKDKTCTHPDLKVNGGEGLEVKFSSPFGGDVIVCFSDGTSAKSEGMLPATKCKGYSK